MFIGIDILEAIARAVGDVAVVTCRREVSGSGDAGAARVAASLVLPEGQRAGHIGLAVREPDVPTSELVMKAILSVRRASTAVGSARAAALIRA